MSDEDAGELIPSGSPTGRLKSQDLMDMVQHFFPSRLPTYLREPMAALENSPEIPILTGMDFGRLEARTVAMLMSYDKQGNLHVEHIHEGDLYRGQKADLIIIDEIAPMIGEDLFDQLFGDKASIPLVSGGRGHGKTNMMLQYYGLKDMPEPVGYKDIPRKSVKQNGKDASYLDLDPTKKHRRKW